MSIVVQKFGGTSLADTDKIKNVARAVVKEKELGNDVIVVVSAMGHTTDNLIKLAHEISAHPSEREMDMLMSTGEQVSIALLTMAIQEMGYSAVSMTGAQVGILTEETHSKARIVDIKTDKLTQHIEDGKIIIVAGFQGVTKKGEITTLGRGGSDTSAVAIAAAMKVDRCDIYSDVEGIYTTDPRVVPTAQKLKEISYEEMLELWDEQMVSYGQNIIRDRENFVKVLDGIAKRVHAKLSGNKEELSIRYEKSVEPEQFLEILKKNRERDKKFKMTFSGPHRDDLSFMAGNIDIRKFGSQGQQRTVALSLKLAEIDFVRREIKDTPVLLLDDVLSELDSRRQSYLLDSIHDIQTLITCTGLDDFIANRFEINKVFYVEEGKAEEHLK